MKILMLRFDAPLMSFGGVMVDNYGVTTEFPARSLVAGLLANALGWDHAHADTTQRLQDGITIAARCDQAGEKILDYQTVDLGQSFLREGWTTRGKFEKREGGNSVGTHIRYRHLWADRVMTVAVAVTDPACPTLEELAAALTRPTRPLFIGRKACLPASPIALGIVEATDVLEALTEAPRSPRSGAGPITAWWPAELGERESSRRIQITDDREWKNQIHTGRRAVFEGWISPPEAPDA